MNLVSSHDVLFRQLLGAEAFDALPLPVQRLHMQQGRRRYRGDVQVTRGDRWMARLCAWVTRLPPAGTGPITVDIVSGTHGEHWTRHVGRHAMVSTLWAEDGLLCERLGLVTFGFRLALRDGGIDWIVQRVRVIGVLPLPAAWFANVSARESVEGERYHFNVRAALPLAGLLVHYQGWLEVP